jgi:protease I
MSISQIEVKDYLALVIIGGIGSKTYLWDNADLHQVVKRADEERIVVAAICLSPVVLAKAGVLEGKEATVYPDPEAIAELEKGGATFRNKSVVASDNIITGRGPKASKSFATTIVKTLAENPSLFPLSANALSVMLRN